MRTFSLEKKGRRKFRPKKATTADYAQARKIRETTRWKKLRQAFKAHHPICMYCEKKPTYCPHHIEPVVGEPDLAFDWDNLFAVCQDCHDEIHQRMLNGDQNKVKKELKKKVE